MCELLVCYIDLHVTVSVCCCMLLTYIVKSCYWLTMWQLCDCLWVAVCCWLTLWKSVLLTYIVKVCVAYLHCEYLCCWLTLWMFVICWMLLTYLVTALWKSVSCLCVAVTAPPLLDVGSAFNVVSNQRQNVCKL